MNEQDHTDGGTDDAATTARLAAIEPTLRDRAVWSEPPPWLGDSIVSAIESEAAVRSVHELRDRRRRSGRVPSPRPVGRWILLSAAAVALIVAVGVIAGRSGGDDGDQLAIGPAGPVPGASANAVVTELDAGAAIALEVEGLPPAPDGQYYAGWVRSEDGELVGVGSFHMRGGDGTVTLWSGVAIEDYPILSITLQTEGQGEESSGEVLLRGSLVD